MKKCSYRLLYILWAAMYALTVVLGFLFPDVPQSAGKAALAAVSVLFFVPPWMILIWAKAEKHTDHVQLVRYISLASVVLTLLLLVANLRSTGLSEAAGDALHGALVVVSAPMVCSNFFVLPIFFWGTLIMGSLLKKL